MAIEHPSPTEATVKSLYAQSFGCAFEDCRRPLYRVDDETGIRTLNSRVCHIHARREGGPRWDRNQPAELNRSAENLVLMCVEHATVIDDPRMLSSYPPERLRQLKQSQLEEYDRIQQGWILNTEMAQQAIAASVPPADVLITDSKVSLGGEGGNAPGAGGGGGGAIGRGARGGRGGSGGEYHVDHGAFSLPWAEDAPSHLNSSELTALGVDFVPGAGGGGAGAIGEGVTGGDGGDGGNCVSGLIDLSQLRHAGFQRVECVIGREGENGTNGGDTIVNFLAEDGRVLKTILAAGGQGGGTKIPEGCAEVGPSDVASKFRISTLLVANSLEIREGLFFMLGADWDNYSAPHLPVDAVWPVAYSFRWEAFEWTEPRAVFLSLLRPDGSEAVSQPLIIPIESGPAGMWRGCCGLNIKLDGEGLWAVRLHSGGLLLGQIPIAVTDISNKQ